MKFNTDYKSKEYYDGIYATIDEQNASHKLFMEAVSLYVAKKRKEALELFIQSANLGHREAFLYIGIMYVMGIYLPKDIKTGLEYIKHSARQYSPYACVELTLLYDDGYTAISVDEARHFLELLSNFDESNEELGGLFVPYARKRLLEGFDKTPYQLAEEDVEQGNIDALFSLYTMYKNNDQNDIALNYLKLAYDNKQKDALLLVAKQMMKKSNADTGTINRLVRMAVKRGNGEAMMIMGQNAYDTAMKQAERAVGSQKIALQEKAVKSRLKWFLMAGGTDYKPVMKILADEFFDMATSDNNKDSYRKAYEWYLRGYRNGDKACLERLAYCCLNGIGT
ncbi:MAG: hypothetical protein PHW00_03830 [Clostridia bacterium]|nr:hypothetical protein [Clostridia bacterium]